MNQKSLSIRFIRDAVSLLGAQGVITIITIANAVVMARALGAEGRGQFSLAVLLPYMLITFTDFGLPVAGTKFMAARSWNAPDIFASHALAGLVRVLVAGLIGLGMIAFAREAIFPGLPTSYLFLGLLQIIPLTIAGFMPPLILGIGKGTLYSQLLVVSSALAFGALGLAWVTVGLDVSLALLLQLIAGLVTAVIIWRMTGRATGGLGRPRISYLAAAYRFGSGIYVSSLSNFASAKLILLFINGYNGAVAVGLFTIAQTASERLYLLGDSIGTILLPHVAESPERNSARLTPIVFRVTIFMVLCISLLLALIANWLVPFLFSKEFSGAVPILYLLLVGVVFFSGWRVLSQDLNARGRSGLTAVVNGTAALVSLGISVVLLPRVGVVGAAWALIVSSVLSLSSGLWLFNHFSKETQGLTSLFVVGAREREIVRRVLHGFFHVLRLGPASWWALFRAHFLDK